MFQGRRGFGLSAIEGALIAAIAIALAGITFFVVASLHDRRNEAACERERRRLQIAQEAAFGDQGRYRSERALIRARFLEDESTLWDTAPTDGARGYTITASDRSPCREDDEAPARAGASRRSER